MKKWLKGIRARLILFGIIPVISSLILSIVSFYGFNELNARLDNAYDVRMKLISTYGDMNSSVHAIGRWLWISYGITDDKKRETFINFSKIELKKLESIIVEYNKMPRNPEIIKKFEPVLIHFEEVKKVAKESVELLETNNLESREKARSLLQTKLAPNLVPITLILQDIRLKMDEILKNEIKSKNNLVVTIKNIFLFVAIISSVFALMFSFMYSNKISIMFSNISNELISTSTELSKASNQIATSSQELSQSTIEEASSIEETSSSLEEINALVSDNAENARKTRDISHEASSELDIGKSILNRLMNSMTNLEKSNSKSSEHILSSSIEIKNLGNVMDEIITKTKVINDIVFQTKLLSFNASVEAARAGEQGKGFAVVAEEIGNLANMSGNASKEISELLERSNAVVLNIVTKSTKTSSEIIQDGQVTLELAKKATNETNEIFSNIISKVDTVSSSTDSVLIGSTEQAKGVEEINKAIAQLSTVSHQNSSAATELSNTAVKLSNQVNNLNLNIKYLNSIVNG